MNRSAAEYARALCLVHEVMAARSKGFTWTAALRFMRNEVGAVPAYDLKARDRIVLLCDDMLRRERNPGGDPLEFVRSIVERWVENEFHASLASH